MILINLFFGAVANAAYAIATQVSNYQNSLGFAIIRPTRSAMMNLQGQGNQQSINRLTLWSSKYAVLAYLLFLMPVQFEAPYLLRIWLVDTPRDTVILVRLVLIWTCLHGLRRPLEHANFARGKIARYMQMMAMLELACLATIWAGLYFMDMDVWFVPAATILFAVLMVIGAALYSQRSIGIHFSDWIKQTIIPVTGIAAASFLTCAAVWSVQSQGWIRLIDVTILNGFVCATLTWYLAMSQDEREYFKSHWYALVGSKQR